MMLGTEETTERRADFLEHHYTVAQLAKAWGMGQRNVRSWFKDEPGVLKYGAARLARGRQRTHVSLRIPESVARRVYRRRTGREVYPAKGSGPERPG